MTVKNKYSASNKRGNENLYLELLSDHQICGLTYAQTLSEMYYIHTYLRTHTHTHYSYIHIYSNTQEFLQ